MRAARFLSQPCLSRYPEPRKKFRRFVARYSGQNRFFNSVSVGDLYKYLTYFGWIADGGLIDAPGRIHRFGHESESFLTFIERSGVPVTGEYVHRITMRIAKVLQKNFRVKPRQHLSKSYRTSSKRIGEVISQEIKNPIPDDLIVALDPILDRF
jgi:hypothetical protein